MGLRGLNTNLALKSAWRLTCRAVAREHARDLLADAAISAGDERGPGHLSRRYGAGAHSSAWLRSTVAEHEVVSTFFTTQWNSRSAVPSELMTWL